MADEAAPLTACPWCSEPLPMLGVTDCPSCGAHLVEEASGEVPGVTAVDPGLLRAAATPHRVKRTFGSLLVGDDNEIPPPSEAEMPALARPDAEVRREMLRLEMEARLAALQAEARMLDAEDGIVGGEDAAPADPGAAEPGAAEPPDVPDDPQAPAGSDPAGSDSAGS